MTLSLAVVVLLIGLIVGYRLGIRRAEWGIAASNARKTIKNRAAWRQN